MFSIVFGFLIVDFWRATIHSFILRGSGYSLDNKDEENFRMSANHTTAVIFYEQLLAAKNTILLQSSILRNEILLLLVLLL